MRAVAVLVLCCAAVTYGYQYSQQIQDIEEGVVTVARCDRSFHSIAGKCYKFHQSRRTWDDALEVCEGEGAQLASILTQGQYTGTLAHINANYPGTYWTSGAVVNGQWKWTATGSSMEQSWWGRRASTSQNLCAYFCSNTLKYWDKACSNSLRFICQKNPVGVVQAV